MLEKSKPRTLRRVRDVAECLDVGERTVYHWIARGDVKAIRVGRTWRIPAAEFDRITGTTRAA